MLKRSMLAVLVAMGVILSSGIAKAELVLMKSKYDVTFYGYIKAEAVYQQGRGISDNYAIIAYPDIEPYKHQETLSFTARQSRFGFDIAAPGAMDEHKVLGKLEMDFYGKGSQPENKAALMLRQAYVSYKTPMFTALAGQAWMLMSPLYPHVSNYPAGAGMGNVGYRMPQMRVEVNLPMDFRVGVSAGEKIEGDFITADFDAGDRSQVPDMQWSVGYFGAKNKIVVAYSGHWGEEMYDEATIDPTNPYAEKTFESYSHNVSVNVPIGKMFAISGEWFYGANLDGWYTGSFGQGVGIKANGNRTPIRDTGGWAELMVKPIKQVTLYLGWGIDDAYDKDLVGGVWHSTADANPFDFTALGFKAIDKNEMYYGHIYYNITDDFRVSFEAMKIITEYLKVDPNDPTDDKGEQMRYDLAFWFFF